ncbi:MAG: hypothetical protein IT321_15510 [Anaerolineae bacterium]|nr:hypothetical protein [Anaerolineae bacterium]
MGCNVFLFSEQFKQEDFMCAFKRLWIIVIIIALIPVFTTNAAAYLVNSALDEHDYVINGVCETQPGNSVCTLRAALDEANAAGGGWHHITLAPTSIGLSKSNGAFVINTGVKVSIEGTGTLTVLDGGGYSGVRIFTVERGAWLRLSHLTLANGTDSGSGGGIQNRGNTFIYRVILSGHHATSSGISGNAGRGAAIFNESGSILTIEQSTLVDNQSRGSGGAIRNEGTVTILNSTFARNDGYAGGGGALANTGLAFVYTSTFSGNHSSGAGAIWNDFTGLIYIYSSTFADNYSHSNGLSTTLNNSGTMYVINSIVYALPGGSNCDGAIKSLGYNLSNDASCGLNAHGDQQGVDPQLAPLTQNGGATETRRLLNGSAAIDTGFCIGLDQRGYPRPIRLTWAGNIRNKCDVGAFELQRNEVR